MVNAKPAWHAILPGGKAPGAYSLDELRAAKQAHAFLTEEFPGPEGIGYYIRAFRYLMFFGVACVAEDKFPALTRCWKELEQVFMRDPAFDDGVFVEGWILMDFPFGPEGQTALDYFEQFVADVEGGEQLKRFIDEGRRSRLGLHQDVTHTKKVAKFRELFTGRVFSAYPSIDHYGKGEILLARTMTYGEQVFIFGNPKGFPREAKESVEGMVSRKLFYFDDVPTVVEQYEKFMKLAGPYWMSCVASDEDLPILDPDHYISYLGVGA